MSERYIAFLRGINVGGHNVKMDRIRDLFTELGLTNVRSYIASGNLFFDTDRKDRNVLAKTLEERLLEVLGFQVPVFLRTITELDAILVQNPFKEIPLTENLRFSVVFTDTPLNENQDLPIWSSKEDMELIAVNPFEAFIIWHIINGRPPSGQFPKELLPARNTSRFFHTLVKIRNAAVR